MEVTQSCSWAWAWAWAWTWGWRWKFNSNSFFPYPRNLIGRISALIGKRDKPENPQTPRMPQQQHGMKKLKRELKGKGKKRKDDVLGPCEIQEWADEHPKSFKPILQPKRGLSFSLFLSYDSHDSHIHCHSQWGLYDPSNSPHPAIQWKITPGNPTQKTIFPINKLEETIRELESPFPPQNHKKGIKGVEEVKQEKEREKERKRKRKKEKETVPSLTSWHWRPSACCEGTRVSRRDSPAWSHSQGSP
jgi:hypothetical protein